MTFDTYVTLYHLCANKNKNFKHLRISLIFHFIVLSVKEKMYKMDLVSFTYTKGEEICRKLLLKLKI